MVDVESRQERCFNSPAGKDIPCTCPAGLRFPGMRDTILKLETTALGLLTQLDAANTDTPGVNTPEKAQSSRKIKVNLTRANLLHRSFKLLADEHCPH